METLPLLSPESNNNGLLFFRRRKVYSALVALSLVAVLVIVYEANSSDISFSSSAGIQRRLRMISPHFSQQLAQEPQSNNNKNNNVQEFVQWLPEQMRKLINASVNPCDDFHAFACGVFEEETKIPKDKSSFDYSWDGDAKEISHELQKIMEEDKDGKVGAYFSACMNSELVEQRGIIPAEPWIALIDSIDNLDTLAIAVAKLHQAEVGCFFDWFLATDDQEPSRELLMLDQGGLNLPDSSYYTDTTDRNKKHLEIYRTFLVNLYQLYQVPKDESEKIVAAVLEVENTLASHAADDNALHGAPKYTLVTLEKAFPHFRWRSYFAAVDHADIASDYEQITVTSPKWMKALDDMIGSLPLEKIKMYLKSHFMFNVSPLLGKVFFDNNLLIDSDLYGVSAHPKRSEKCVGATKAALPFLVSKMFVDKYFPISAKMMATNMLENIREAFQEDLDTVPWMSKESRAAAKDKLAKIFFEVGYPSEWPQYHFTVTDSTYFENSLRSSIWRSSRKFLRLREKVERHRWTMCPATVNAYYDNGVNGVFVPAGLLQPPFFDPKMPLAHNYGSAGSIMTHEVTHGFDSNGRKYDAECRKRQWWDSATTAEFESRAACIARVYGDFKIAGSHVHGNNTLGENIADIGGVKMSYAAYLKEEAKNNNNVGADLNNKRMFWTSFAQSWCGVTRRRVQKLNLLTDVHSPEKYRIIGPLQQNVDFAKDFSCPLGSPMNPEKKCELW